MGKRIEGFRLHRLGLDGGYGLLVAILADGPRLRAGVATGNCGASKGENEREDPDIYEHAWNHPRGRWFLLGAGRNGVGCGKHVDVYKVFVCGVFCMVILASIFSMISDSKSRQTARRGRILIRLRASHESMLGC